MSAPLLQRPARVWAELAERPLGPTRGWAPAWRMARRDLRRHPARTAAAAVMVAVPVMLACALAVVLPTLDVSQRERDLAGLAAAEAVVLVDPTVTPGARGRSLTDVEESVGVGLVEVRRGGARVEVGANAVEADSLVTDLADPTTRGLVAVVAGRLPTGADEVALSPGLAGPLGLRVGDLVDVGGQGRTVSGLAVTRWANPSDPLVVGSPAAVGGTVDPTATTWLAPSADSADSSVQAGRDGLLLLGRQDVARAGGGFELGTPDGATVIVLSVGITLVVLEIALLAGPAFAVGVRQQRRTLALLAATGGDGRALRRIVLLQALAIGAGSAVMGATLGAGAAVALLLGLRHRVDVAVGPVEVLWPLVVVFVLIGVVAAAASALVPALTASRATVVAALSSRTTSRRLPWRRPSTGVLLLLAGTLLLRAAAGGAVEATVGASVAVLLLGVGMVLVVPLPVALLGTLTTRLPLGLRLAGRESSRAAGRSTAAVAAVAGASAVLIAALTLTADTTEADRTRYQPQALPGVTVVQTDQGAEEVVALAEELLPGSRSGVSGGTVQFGAGEVEDFRYADMRVPTPGCPGWRGGVDGTCGYAWQQIDGVYGPAFGSADAVGAELAGYDLDPGQLAVLADGGVLLAEGSPATIRGGVLEVVATMSTEDGTDDVVTEAVLPVGRWSPAREGPVLLLGERAARALGVWFPDRVFVQPAAQVADPLTTADLDDPAARTAATDQTAPLRQAAERDRSLRASVTTEVGYTDSFAPVVDAVVVIAALVVLLGATFTATALALADARGDRVVLTALGAPPATQRVAAGGTAALIAATGALVGGLVGLVPGVLVGRAVLQPSVVSWGLGVTDGVRTSVTPVLLLVPWGWLAVLLVGMPLLAGLVVAAVAAGRPDAEAARLSARVG